MAFACTFEDEDDEDVETLLRTTFIQKLTPRRVPGLCSRAFYRNFIIAVLERHRLRYTSGLKVLVLGRCPVLRRPGIK